MRTLLVLIVAGAAGYYIYQGTFAEPEDPSCEQQLAKCISDCRGSATDAAASRDCQEACRREQAACERAAG